jgi:hypothetical protein
MKQMDRRAWRFKRATLVIGLALSVLSNAVLVTTGRAQRCDCETGHVGPCPEPIPVLETLGGNSLFWHDPCGNGYRDPDWDCLFHDSTPPVWYVSAEFLPLFRDQRGTQVFQALAVAQTNAVTTYNRQAVLSTGEFNTDFNPGIRATIGRALGDWYRLEGSYFGSYSWSDSASVRYSAVAPPIPFDPGTPGTFNPGTPATFNPGIPATFNPGTPATFDPGVPPSFTADPPSFDPGIPPTFNPGTPATFTPGTPATFHPGTPPSFTEGTPPTAYDPGDGLLSPFSNFGNPNGFPGLGAIAEVDYIPSPLYDYNDYASIRFVSTMDDAQLNLRRRIRTAVDRQVRAETSCLLGLRYMNIAESFWYEARSPLRDGTQSRAVHTNNDLFGVQLGALAQFLVVDRGWIDLEIKGVMFFNEASNRIQSNFLIDPDPAQVHRTSFMGDLSLNFNYQFAPAWTFRAGYNAMRLSGVALASENALVNIDTLVSSANAVYHKGDVVYHGPSIGIVYAR